MRSRIRSSFVVALLVIGALGTTHCGGGEAAGPGPAAAASPPPAGSRSVALYYPDTKSPDYARSCGAVSPVLRDFSASDVSPRGVLEALFRGPRAEERARGLHNPFDAKGSGGKNAKNLVDYLRSVKIEGTHAVVDFAPPAMDWLDNTTCIQEAVKTPIQRTLNGVFGVDTVDFAIDGKIVKEWDA